MTPPRISPLLILLAGRGASGVALLVLAGALLALLAELWPL